VGFFDARGGGWWVAAAVTVLAGCTKRPPPEALGSTSAELTCAPSLTTRVDVASDLARPLELPRLDTNDLPTSESARPTTWTVKILRDRHG